MSSRPLRIFGHALSHISIEEDADPLYNTISRHAPVRFSKRKLDIGLAYDLSNECENSDRLHCDWSHIPVSGKLKSNPREKNHNSTSYDILRYTREVFGAQDTRRFVLGFTLCGSKMRLWEFDRLGRVASESFDVNKDGRMFVSAVLGFLWMSEEELGFDPTIVKEDSKRCTEIRRDGQVERLCLRELMERKRSVAGRELFTGKAA